MGCNGYFQNIISVSYLSSLSRGSENLVALHFGSISVM